MIDYPLVSVVIPSYNSARFVAQAVQSVLDQTYEPIEIIVVNDGSTDNTLEELAPWMSHIRYVHQANSGVSKARNRGIEESRGDLIAFLDADDRWLPEKLQKQWECFRANKEVGMVHTDSYDLNESTGDVIYVNCDRQRFAGSCYAELFQRNSVTTSSTLVTRKCLDVVGGFDEAIRRASVEDRDLWLRIARRYPIAYVNEPLVLYRKHSASASHDCRGMYEDRFYVLAKTLRSDPALWETLGRDRVQLMMSELAFAAGYANTDVGDLRRARGYFREALRYTPLSLKTWAFWASTLLTPGLRSRLRQLKQSYAAVAV